MTDDTERRGLQPWHIVIALAIVGVVGAVMVMKAARTIDRIDRIDVERWEAYLLPQIAKVRSQQSSLIALAGRASDGATEATLDPELRRIRGALQSLRRPLQEQRYPSIVIPATGRYLTVVGETLAALAILENALTADDWTTQRAAFDAKIRAAEIAYRDGERLRARLRARAGLPAPSP